MLLGLTGGYCAGKNAVTAILQKMGWICIDVDALGHEAVELARDEIVRRFGTSVLGPDGFVDRKAVARIVFADPAALADQEAIVHPIAIRLTDERIAASEAEAKATGRVSLICINAALLYRAPQAARCDAIIEVRAPLITRIRRAKARDGIGTWRALERIMLQRALWRLRKASGSPILVLRNSRSRKALESAAAKVLSDALAIARRSFA
jgi:dephospho-CoA kinase